jgi:hypothetical protein
VNQLKASFGRKGAIAIAICLLQVNLAMAAEPAAQSVPLQPAAAKESDTQQASAPVAELRHSWNPLNSYRGQVVPPPSMANSVRLDTLIRDGKL